jgi:hypothetical protein
MSFNNASTSLTSTATTADAGTRQFIYISLSFMTLLDLYLVREMTCNFTHHSTLEMSYGLYPSFVAPAAEYHISKRPQLLNDV